MIRGYPREPSVFPGDDLQICVATTANQFTVEFYHQGEKLDAPQTLPQQAGPFSPAQGAPADPDNPAQAPGGGDWGWQAYTFTIPDDWSGVYIAMLIEQPPNPQQLDKSSTFSAILTHVALLRVDGGEVGVARESRCAAHTAKLKASRPRLASWLESMVFLVALRAPPVHEGPDVLGGWPRRRPARCSATADRVRWGWRAPRPANGLSGRSRSSGTLFSFQLADESRRDAAALVGRCEALPFSRCDPVGRARQIPP